LPVLQAGIIVPTTLEALYRRQIWETELSTGRLIERDRTKVFSPSIQRGILHGEIQIDDLIEPEWSVYALYDFNNDRKVPQANIIVRLPDAEARTELTNFKTTLESTLAYLGLIPN